MKQEMTFELSDVWVQYEENVVLREISLCLPHPAFLGVIGPNGGGKTTFLRVLLGLIKPTRGKVSVFGIKPEEARRKIGYVPQLSQADRSFPVSVEEVVLMGRLAKRGFLAPYDETDRQAAAEALGAVNMLVSRHRQVGELSAGQRQRVLIARALASEPKLLLLDEPTASVDKPMETSVFELLGRLKEKLTIVMVSHDIGVVASYVDKIACLNCQLYYHDSKEVLKEDLEAAYRCPIDLIGHGVPHRVVEEHRKGA